VNIIAHEPVVVSADAGRLRQVIANVVVNAAEATAPSGKISKRIGRHIGAGWVL
jgi:signal transduction histidine kinase